MKNGIKMKNIILFLGMICWAIIAEAQSRSIRFVENAGWPEVVAKAKQENKIIFVDCYTSWCGPCRFLATKIFTNDSVADFFNDHFLCVKYDMETSSDGLALGQRYGVKFYPTLLFISSEMEDEIHRMVGAGGGASWLIDGGKLALDAERNLYALQRRYRTGERGIDFLKEYLNVLASAYMQEEVKNVTADYLDVLPLEELATKENWDLISRHVKDPLAISLQTVMSNRDKFYALVGREAVDKKLTQCIAKSVEGLMKWRQGSKRKFDDVYNKALTDYLEKIDFEAAPAALAGLRLAAYTRQGEYRKMLDQLKHIEEEQLWDNMEGVSYFLNCMWALLKCGDQELIREGLDWTAVVYRQADRLTDKINITICKKRLQEEIGDVAGARKSGEEYEALVEQRKLEK